MNARTPFGIIDELHDVAAVCRLCGRPVSSPGSRSCGAAYCALLDERWTPARMLHAVGRRYARGRLMPIRKAGRR